MRLTLPAAVLLLVLAAPFAVAQPPALAAPARAQVQAVAARLRPTSCTPSLSAANCPTEEAAQFRARIATLLARGLTPRQIVAEFVRAYGPQVLFVPPSRGAAALIWVLPFCGVVIGAGIWWRFVRARGTPGAAGPAAGSAPAAAAPPDAEGIDPGLSDYL